MLGILEVGFCFGDIVVIATEIFIGNEIEVYALGVLERILVEHSCFVDYGDVLEVIVFEAHKNCWCHHQGCEQNRAEECHHDE